MALFGLHTPTFGPLHPIIGKLDGSTGLSGFTNTYIPFGNAAGGLEDSANLTWNGSKLWVYGGGRFGDKVEYGSEYEYDIGEEW